MEANQQYLLEIQSKTDNQIESLRSYAEENAVPIVDRLSLEMIKQLIRIHGVKNILEIGT
ncbi:O-methyltransferase, partial [Staphylococcus borealis]